MPDLHEDSAARGMNRIRDFLPLTDLFVRVDTRLAREGRRLRGNHGAFGNDQTTAGTLSVVLAHQLIGHMIDRATAGQGRHNDAIWNIQRTELKGLE